jgi:hypothetical protein
MDTSTMDAPKLPQAFAELETQFEGLHSTIKATEAAGDPFYSSVM